MRHHPSPQRPGDRRSQFVMLAPRKQRNTVNAPRDPLQLSARGHQAQLSRVNAKFTCVACGDIAVLLCGPLDHSISHGHVL